MSGGGHANQTSGEIMIILVRCAAIMAAAIALIQYPVGACRRLSEPPGHLDRAVGAGRRGRYLGRIIAPKLSERLGKPVVIENRGGGGLDARHRDRGQGRAGRLHARHAGQRLDGDRTRDVQAAALRSDQGFRADGARSAACRSC